MSEFASILAGSIPKRLGQEITITTNDCAFSLAMFETAGDSPERFLAWKFSSTPLLLNVLRWDTTTRPKWSAPTSREQ